jgi:Fe-S-cluster containining protein
LNNDDADYEFYLRKKVRKQLLSIVREGMFTSKEINKAVKRSIRGGVTSVQLGILTKMQGDLCERCGECCRRNHPISIDCDDIDVMSSYLNMSVGKFHGKYVFVEDDDLKLKSDPCIFLRVNECLIYSARPKVCRGFPVMSMVHDVFEKKEKIQVFTYCAIIHKLFAYNCMPFLLKEKMPRELWKKLREDVTTAFSDVKGLNEREQYLYGANLVDDWQGYLEKRSKKNEQD